MKTHYNAIDWNMIVDRLKGYALSAEAQQSLEDLSPSLNEAVCRQKMAETTSARRLLDALGAPPLPLMTDLAAHLACAERDGILLPEQLGGVATFAASCRRMSAYLRKGEATGEPVAAYGRSIEDLSALQKEIERCINGDWIHDEASTALKQIRRKKAHAEGQIKEKLSRILQSRREYLADGYITTRQGRYVVPVLRKYQSQFGGTVVEASGKGGTVFIEPSAIADLQGELTALTLEEGAEEQRILYTLTACVAEHTAEIGRNMEVMESIDVLFAKAKLSAAMNALPAEIGTERRIDIRQGRHPLLQAEACVPLDIRMGDGMVGIVITGPNTGGKTVALKTVGLLTLMAQCGLHIPCAAGSYIAMQDGVWCDIGDGQNITQNLSTFSGHMTNVISILSRASRDSLVLLDELGSGTDPAEGMGIAVAVLEELRRRGCMFMVTTHYPQVKQYAQSAQGVETARMAFDRESLRPLYRLEMGKAGESCALHIAGRLGLAPHLLRWAHAEVYGGPGAYRDETDARAESPLPKSRLVRAVPKREGPDLAEKFHMGDSVTVLPDGEIGIVYRPADKNGDVIVQVKGVKRKVKHNRLRIKVAAAELYPPDYDFSILFDTVEQRKARHQMDRKFSPDITISYTEIE